MLVRSERFEMRTKDERQVLTEVADPALNETTETRRRATIRCFSMVTTRDGSRSKSAHEVFDSQPLTLNAIAV